jgi:hypothetical protein
MPEILSIGELLDLGNSANMSAYIPYSGLEYNASGAISGISGSAIAGGIESSVVSSIVSSMVSGKADQSAVEDCCSAMSAAVSAKLDATASSLFQPSGNYQPSGDYYSATNPSGFITTADLTDFAKESALSSKLDASASSNFAPSGDYVFESSYSSFTSEVTNNISSISSTVSGLTGTYIEQSASGMFAPSGDYAYNSSLSSKLDASSSSLFAPSGDYAYNSALSSYIPQSSSGQFAPSGDYADASALSSKLDASASSDFYSTSNPSGFITGVDLSPYQLTADMSAYQPSGDYAYNSALSSKVDQSAFDDCCSSVNSALSGKLDASASSMFQPSGEYAPTGDYAFNSSVSSKLDASASSDFYLTSNPSGFIGSGDLSSYVPKSGVVGNPQGYITGILGSAIKQGISAITSAYLIVDSGLELSMSGGSAVLRTSGVEPAMTYGYWNDVITSINGSSLPGEWNTSKSALVGGYVDVHFNDMDIVYKPTPYYTDYGSGSASSTSTATASAGTYPYVFYALPATTDLPIPSPANQYSAYSQTSYSVFHYDLNPDVSAISAIFSGGDYANPLYIAQSGYYEEGAPLSTYTGDGYKRGLLFKDPYSYLSPSNFEAYSIDIVSSKFVNTLVNNACVVKAPTGWLSANSTAMDVGPTKLYTCKLSSLSSIDTYYGSATTSKVIAALYCSGYSPYSVHFSVELDDLPGDMKWYLIQSSETGGNKVIDMCRTTGSSGSVRMDAVTLGRYNSDYCRQIVVSATFASEPGVSGRFSADTAFFHAYQIPTGYVLTQLTSDEFAN